MWNLSKLEFHSSSCSARWRCQYIVTSFISDKERTASLNQILLDLWGSHNIKNPEQGSISLIMAVHNLDCLLHRWASYKILKQWAHSDTDQEEFSRAVFEVWLGDRVHQSSFIIFSNAIYVVAPWCETNSLLQWHVSLIAVIVLGEERNNNDNNKKAPNFFLGWGSFLLFCAW